MLLLEVTHLKKSRVFSKSPFSVNDLKGYLSTAYGLEGDQFYFTHNGKLVSNSDSISDGVIYAIPRLVGGKGGFGSMLRAIGAQIEKTTNREACRDLSGRRLRDINEEKRLKNWIAQQADREREAAEKRKKKLERMCAEPKHEFEDKEYDKQRSELLDKVWDAVDQGMKASTSGCSTSANTNKRKLQPEIRKKRTQLWVDDIEDEDVSSSDDSEEESPKKVMKIEADQDVKGTTDETVCSEKNEEEESPKIAIKSEVDGDVQETTDETVCSETKKECTKENGHDCSENDVSPEMNVKEEMKDSSATCIEQVATG